MRTADRLALAVLLAAPTVTAPTAAQAPPGSDLYLVAFGPEVDLRLAEPRRLTDRAGYDNQPTFTPDGAAIFYTSIRDDGQADTYRYTVATGEHARVTRTPESEYSPTVVPDGGGFSVVRVEADSAQRLWAFDLEGLEPRVLLEAVAPVGYHAWVDRHTVALYVLGTPATLQLADIRTGAAEVVAARIGRSLHAIPGRRAVSFLEWETEERGWIKALDVDSRASRVLIRALEGNEFHAWTPDGALLSARDARLYRWRPGTDASWQEIADFTGALGAISRLAVSPDGRWLAVVASRADE